MWHSWGGGYLAHRRRRPSGSSPLLEDREGEVRRLNQHRERAASSTAGQRREPDQLWPGCLCPGTARGARVSIPAKSGASSGMRAGDPRSLKALMLPTASTCDKCFLPALWNPTLLGPQVPSLACGVGWCLEGAKSQTAAQISRRFFLRCVPTGFVF